MIKIAKSGAVLSMPPDEKTKLSGEFERNHFVRFPQLLDHDILRDFNDQLRSEAWVERVHEGIGVEVCLNDKGPTGLMNFLFNDQALFGVLQEITGCERIGTFEGRFYRMIPNAGHYDSWHTDVSGHRLLALSINLSPELYEGGTLQIRLQGEKDIFAEVPNIGFGDAILFRIVPGLEHRVSTVSGNAPKTAFAGWFKNQPDFWDELTKNISTSH